MFPLKIDSKMSRTKLHIIDETQPFIALDFARLEARVLVNVLDAASKGATSSGTEMVRLLSKIPQVKRSDAARTPTGRLGGSPEVQR